MLLELLGHFDYDALAGCLDLVYFSHLGWEVLKDARVLKDKLAQDAQIIFKCFVNQICLLR